MTNSTTKPWVKAGIYFSLFAACLLAEIALSWEKLALDGVNSWTLFLIMPVIAVATAHLIHVAVDDFLSCSWRFFRAPVAAALAVLGLSVIVPASISSSGSARDAAVNKAEAANTVVDEAKEEARRLQRKLEWAEEDKTKKCARHGQNSNKCKDAKDSIKSFEDRREKLLHGVAETPVKAATSGEKRLVWAFALANMKVTEDDIVNALPMMLSITVALMGPFFGAAGLSELKRNKVVPLTVPSSQEMVPVRLEPIQPDGGSPRKRKRKEITSSAIDFTAEHIKRHGRPPSWTDVRSYEPKLSKASASRARKEGIRVASVA